MTDKVRIQMGWNNRTDGGTLSAGSWSATLPLNNLKNRQVQKVARSTDATNASTKFVIDLGTARSIGVLALIVHNISVAGLVRVRGNSANSFASPIYDSGWVLAWPTGMIPQDLLEWEDDNFWLGTLSQEARAGYHSPFIHLLSAANNLRYWQVEIDDTTNADGFISVGRLFMSSVWKASVDYSFGAGLKFEDPTPIEVSLSGAEYFDVRSRPRNFNFELSWITDSEAYNNVLELQRLSGVSGEVLIVPDSADSANLPKRSFVGRLKSLSSIITKGVDQQSGIFEFKELI